MRRALDHTGAGDQPEGAGAFREDPVAWITEGGYNSVQDYGLGIWWEDGTDVIGNAMESGDPRPIERALRAWAIERALRAWAVGRGARAGRHRWRC